MLRGSAASAEVKLSSGVMCCPQLEERVAQLNVRLAEVQKDAQVSAQLLLLCRASRCHLQSCPAHWQCWRSCILLLLCSAAARRTK